MKTHRTIPNKKLDIIIHDNEKGTCTLINVAISEDGMKLRRLKNIKTYMRSTVYLESENKSDISTIRDS